MHATIGAVVVVDSDNGNVFIGENDSRDHMKYDDGAYDGFENDVDMDESVDWTSTKIEADTYDNYIGAEL